MDAATFSYAADWTSVISFAITLVNTYLILRIKSGIVVNLTLEPMLDRLSENSAEMNRHLIYYESSDERFVEVAGICEANIRTIRRRLGYFRARFLRHLLRSLRAFQRNRSRQSAQDVYARLQQVRQHLANLLEEKRITG